MNLSVVMILAFGVVIYLGHFGLVALVCCLQVAGFRELMAVRDSTDASPSDEVVRMPTLIMDCLLFFSVQYTTYGLIFISFFGATISDTPILRDLAAYHLLICGALFSIAIVFFVLTLEKGHYKTQYKNVTWTVMGLVAIAPSNLHVVNIFHGLAWFLLPVLLIITNDCTAYIWGFFFGRTSLIQLSPKKTWEGFLGALVSTVALAYLFAMVLNGYHYFNCPKHLLLAGTCSTEAMFQVVDYHLPAGISKLGSLVGLHLGVHRASPFRMWSLGFGLFASLIAPFGGFIASGFKRAHGIKDFGTLIPGHGGIVDRMDCQVIMAAFSFVVYMTIGTDPAVDEAFSAVTALHPYQQLTVYQQLEQSLLQRGML